MSSCPTLAGSFGSSTTRTKSQAPSPGLPVTSRIAPSLRFTLAPTGSSRYMTAALLPLRSCELCDWSMVTLLQPGVVALGALLNGVEIVPAFGFHEGQPAAKAGPMRLLGHGMGEAHAGQPLIFKALAMPADEAIGHCPGDGSQAGGVDVVPILHVVRFG